MDLCLLLSLLSICSPVILVMYISKCSPSLEWSHVYWFIPFPRNQDSQLFWGFILFPLPPIRLFFLIFNFNPTPHVYVYVCVHKYHSMNVNVKRQLPGVCQFFHFTLSSGDQTLRSSNLHILTQMLSSAKPSCYPWFRVWQIPIVM